MTIATPDHSGRSEAKRKVGAADIRAIVQIVTRLPAQALILAVRAYQVLISPWFGPVCRYHPSCSNYMIASVGKHGFWRGAWRGLRRIARCHPWHPGGYDPP